jgi:hypothetical protein
MELTIPCKIKVKHPDPQKEHPDDMTRIDLIFKDFTETIHIHGMVSVKEPLQLVLKWL